MPAASIPAEEPPIVRNRIPAITPYHAKYYAHMLTRRCPPDSVEKLDGWAEDLKLGLEREIMDLDRQIKEARRATTAGLTLEEKLAGQKTVKSLESERSTKRRALFDAQDEIDTRRDGLIKEIEGRLEQRVTTEALFEIRWQVQ